MSKYSLPFQFIVSLSPLAKDLVPIQKTGAAFGRLLWFCHPNRRILAPKTIQSRLHVDPDKARSIAYQSFLHTGKSFLEVVANRNVDHRFVHSRVLIQDPENFWAMASIPRPIVATTAHLGAWELMAGILRVAFQGRRAQIVVKSLKNQSFQSGLTLIRHDSSRGTVTKGTCKIHTH